MIQYFNPHTLNKLIDPHLLSSTKDAKIKVIQVDPITLLTHDRLDLAFKLLFLDLKRYDNNFAEKLYLAHVKALTSGTFIEHGNKKKAGENCYIDSFLDTYKSIKAYGFDNQKSLVPVSKSGYLLNGSHRVASAIHLNKKITSALIDASLPPCDYKLFLQRKVPVEYIELAVQKFLEYSNNCYVAFIWPVAKGNDESVEEIISNIVYQKSIELNSNGAHNLLSQLYVGEHWLGTPEDNFKGVDAKQSKCFENGSNVRVIFFQEDNLESVLKIKQLIRDVFNVGKHAIHITDTKDEVISAAKLVCNKNSLHFLNNAQPNRYLTTINLISKLKKHIKQNKLDSNFIAIDSGLVMAMYGLRETRDVDYIELEATQIEYADSSIEPHTDDLIHHSNTKQQLILDPSNHFWFDNLKFISLQNISDMKKHRAEPKDLLDCKLIEKKLNKDIFKSAFTDVEVKVYYFRLKLKRTYRKVKFELSQLPIRILIYLKLFNFAKSFYHKIKEIVSK